MWACAYHKTCLHQTNGPPGVTIPKLFGVAINKGHDPEGWIGMVNRFPVLADGEAMLPSLATTLIRWSRMNLALSKTKRISSIIQKWARGHGETTEDDDVTVARTRKPVQEKHELDQSTP